MIAKSQYRRHISRGKYIINKYLLPSQRDKKEQKDTALYH